MGYKDITAGDKVAKPLGARFIKSKKGTMAIEVSFEFVEPSTGTPERLSYTGWITKDALPYTMETLVNVLKFNGNETTDSSGVLTDPNAMAYGKEVKIVVALDTNPENGKTYPKIQYVNSLGGSAYQGCEPETIKSSLGALGFKAAYLATRQMNGSGAKTDAAPPKFNDEESIPF